MVGPRLYLEDYATAARERLGRLIAEAKGDALDRIGATVNVRRLIRRTESAIGTCTHPCCVVTETDNEYRYRILQVMRAESARESK